MATVAAEIPRERDLLGRLVSGTAGVVGTAFLRRLVTELAAALDAELAFVAEVNEHVEGWTRTVATAGRIELAEGVEIELAGTPCEHAYEYPMLLVPTGARARYPRDAFLQAHALDGYLAIALRDSSCRPIGHIGVVKRAALDPEPAEIQALYVFAARAAAELERRRHEQALATARARVVQAADDERARIGRDLHDGAPQRLVALALELRTAQERLGHGEDRAVDDLLADAVAELLGAVTDLRELARGIHPATLTEGGLTAALESLAARSPIPVQLNASLNGRPPVSVEATAYFVASEALANVAKHAQAHAATVAARHANGTLVIEVEDDGVGGADLDGGSGLRGLVDRVETQGGSLSIESLERGGTRIVGEIPCAS